MNTTYQTKVMAWPDGTWVETEEYRASDYAYKSDDITYLTVTQRDEATDEENLQTIEDAVTKAINTPDILAFLKVVEVSSATGYNKYEARDALIQSGGNVQDAIYLLENGV